jgi:uncharacterized alkaline shock family protein YloU
VEGEAVISHDVLASYAADAARQVDGVHGLVDGPRRHEGVRVAEVDGAMAVEVHLSLDWGATAPDVAAEVQSRVVRYVVGTARLPVASVDVVVAWIAAASD